jgi:hypothetical protein
MNKRSALITAIGDEVTALNVRGVRLPASVRLLWEQYAGEYQAEKFATKPQAHHEPTDAELLSALDLALDKLNAVENV